MASTAGREEKDVFTAYLTKNHLKRSEQREVILDAFLRSERHLSVDDLLHMVQRKRPDIGRTTVYRTLKLLQAAGLASELALDGESRFERDWKRKHHDHFICKSCGAIFEFRARTSSASRTRSRPGSGSSSKGTATTSSASASAACPAPPARRAARTR